MWKPANRLVSVGCNARARASDPTPRAVSRGVMATPISPRMARMPRPTMATRMVFSMRVLVGSSPRPGAERLRIRCTRNDASASDAERITTAVTPRSIQEKALSGIGARRAPMTRPRARNQVGKCGFSAAKSRSSTQVCERRSRPGSLASSRRTSSQPTSQTATAMPMPRSQDLELSSIILASPPACGARPWATLPTRRRRAAPRSRRRPPPRRVRRPLGGGRRAHNDRGGPRAASPTRRAS